MFEHLRKNEEFQTVYKNGRSVANKHLVMYKIPNGGNRTRFGFSVSKKVGNSVVRHRITRLLRESIRLNESRIEDGYDVVIIARILAKGKNYEEISKSVLHLCKIQKLLK